MHSSLVRLQNVFGFFTTVASCIAVAVALSVLLIPQSPSGSLKLRSVQVTKGRPNYFSTKKEEYANIRFDLDADLSSLYNWNTKQLFLYIVATYAAENPSDPPSQVVIWDAIVPSKLAPFHENQYQHPQPKSGRSSKKQASQAKKTPGILKLSDQRPKYQITDRSGLIAERANATLELNWNIQPWVGALCWTNREGLGLWKALEGGVSETFEFSSVGGKLGGGSGGSAAKDMKTAPGAEKNRGGPGDIII